VNAVNALFAKAGARGVTLLGASGDSGAHGRTDPGCTDPHTRADYPSASPYVTSVGATEIENGKTGTTKAPICQSQLTCATGGYEIVASNKVLAFFSSGGGFSSVAARPSWQGEFSLQWARDVDIFFIFTLPLFLQMPWSVRT
jgi:subtilase family serine protease